MVDELKYYKGKHAKKWAVKLMTFIKKCGWGQDFMKTNFFFAIGTLGGG